MLRETRYGLFAYLVKRAILGAKTVVLGEHSHRKFRRHASFVKSGTLQQSKHTIKFASGNRHTMLSHIAFRAPRVFRPASGLLCVTSRFPSQLLQRTSFSTSAFTNLMTTSRSPALQKTRPTVSYSAITTQIRGMKVRSSVKKLCDGCKVRLRHSTTSRHHWTRRLI